MIRSNTFFITFDSIIILLLKMLRILANLTLIKNEKIIKAWAINDQTESNIIQKIKNEKYTLFLTTNKGMSGGKMQKGVIEKYWNVFGENWLVI